jgi:predicted DNA-binding mobile mystery protein A
VSGAAVNKLERAELHGGITTGKLAEVAAALDCTLVYALVPNSTLERTVMTQARAAASQVLGYAIRTMALEAQEIDATRQGETLERYAQELVASGTLWRDVDGSGRATYIAALVKAARTDEYTDLISFARGAPA